jgi:hypothetical protein
MSDTVADRGTIKAQLFLLRLLQGDRHTNKTLLTQASKHSSRSVASLQKLCSRERYRPACHAKETHSVRDM